MKFLKRFESYQDFKQIQDEIDDIKNILHVFEDDSWMSVRTDFIPKRWENTKSNFIIESDYIQIYLRKKGSEAGSKYPLDAEFNISEIVDLQRIFNIYKNNKIEVNICLSDNVTQGYFSQDFIYGKWVFIERSKIEYFLKRKGNIKILGINIRIFLGTENIDQK
jgi:hypothetical protein